MSQSEIVVVSSSERTEALIVKQFVHIESMKKFYSVYFSVYSVNLVNRFLGLRGYFTFYASNVKSIKRKH